MNAPPLSRTPRRGPGQQRGMTMLVVLLLMIVMLLGAAALARMTEARSQITGNLAFREAAMAAAEVGTNQAFAAARAIANEDTDGGGWYFARTQPAVAGGSGLPAIDWDRAQSLTVDAYTVHYVVERMCQVNIVTDPLTDCLVRQQPVISGQGPKIDPPNVRQFRATVRVQGPKNTTVFVQAMFNR